MQIASFCVSIGVQIAFKYLGCKESLASGLLRSRVFPLTPVDLVPTLFWAKSATRITFVYSASLRWGTVIISILLGLNFTRAPRP
jgi:hypothetical protein